MHMLSVAEIHITKGFIKPETPNWIGVVIGGEDDDANSATGRRPGQEGQVIFVHIIKRLCNNAMSQPLFSPFNPPLLT